VVRGLGQGRSWRKCWTTRWTRRTSWRPPGSEPQAAPGKNRAQRRGKQAWAEAQEIALQEVIAPAEPLHRPERQDPEETHFEAEVNEPVPLTAAEQTRVLRWAQARIDQADEYR
jgi:hypothetical protein